MRMPGKGLWLTVAVVLVALVAAAPVRAGQAAKVDITGAWTFDVVTDAGGPSSPNVTFKQDGEKITGHYSSQTLGEADFTGTLKGQDLAFSFTADIQGTPVPVIYKGTVDTKDSMKGTLDVAGGMATGTFTAKRK